VSLTFNEEGNTLYGDSPEDAVRELEALDVPLVGANCSQGPAGDARDALADGRGRALGEARRDAERRLARVRRRRYVYLCTPEYMATWARRFLEAGASVVGGCCGTTPAHIRDLVRSVRMFQPGARSR
jgi:methionine synthase I (cobalamin-dependent)